ncbi:MAG: complex I NDUFA9 subunit family protein [Hyphomonadaceae bacterium]|nr:complex I NDUFA9 subunit family protein [Hyphomonadaceae bacterium]MBP9233729.1 complex I NDUFA9 subunit family protein [Hyphomonadaceae bacterium]
MTGKIVTVFGGSGFLGRHVVRALCKQGWRVRAASRRPHLSGDVKLAGDVGQVQLVQANVRNRLSIKRALENAEAVVNLVGVMPERGAQTFQGTQALGAANIAQLAAEAGIKNVVLVSAIGANAKSKSNYARTKAEAEASTREAVPSAVILRPSIIFGPEDGFFTRFALMARFTPIMPLIGGATKFQPIYVADVAAAVANALKPGHAGKTFELGGPRTYTMKELLQYITHEIDRPRMLLPVPIPVAAPIGYIVGALSTLNPFFGPPITGDQIQLFKTDNVVAPGANTIADLGVTSLESVEAIVPTYLWRHRPHGQFQPPHIDEASRVDA